MGLEKAWLAIALAPGVAIADDLPASPAPTLLHAELDPLTFASWPGYGGQIGIRHPALGGVRLAIASFALHVPDLVTHALIGDDVDQTVRPSGAFYALYYTGEPGADGFAIGASIRYLRIRYELESDPAMDVDVREISPEVIVGYQWHPWKGRFYVQPWVGLGVVVWRDKDALSLGNATPPYTVDEPPVTPFFTVNLGYEYAL